MGDEFLSRWEILSELGTNEIRQIQSARIAIVGIGGLGCPAALYLAAAGVKSILLIDHGRVDAPDLGRQILYGKLDIGSPKATRAAEKLALQYPSVQFSSEVETFDYYSGKNLLQDVDLVIDGTDSLGARRAINKCALEAKVTAVFGGATRWNGFVQVVTADLPCYDCVWSDRTHCGSCAEVGVFGPLVGIVGSVQASEAIKTLCNLNLAGSGKLILIDCLNTAFRTLETFKRPDCPTCRTV